MLLAHEPVRFYLQRICCVYFVWLRGSTFGMPHLRPADVTFFELKNTVFCVECELMSYNSGANCLGCGSIALITVARGLSGWLGRRTGTQVRDEDMRATVLAANHE